MVGDDHERSRSERRIYAACRIRQDHDAGAKPLEEQDRLDHESRVISLVDVEAALEHDDRTSDEPTEQQPADMTGRRRRGPTREVREGDGDRVVKIVGQSAKPGPEDDPDLGHESRPGSDGSLEGGQTGRLIGRSDGPRRFDGAGWTGRNRRGGRGRRRTRI